MAWNPPLPSSQELGIKPSRRSCRSARWTPCNSALDDLFKREDLGDDRLEASFGEPLVDEPLTALQAVPGRL